MGQSQRPDCTKEICRYFSLDCTVLVQTWFTFFWIFYANASYFNTRNFPISFLIKIKTCKIYLYSRINLTLRVSYQNKSVTFVWKNMERIWWCFWINLIPTISKQPLHTIRTHVNIKKDISYIHYFKFTWYN